MAKITEHVRARLQAGRRLAHYKGVSRKEGRPDKPYDLVSTRVAVYRAKDGSLVDPENSEALKDARTEFHGCSFQTQVWDAIAAVASVTDDVIVEGTLAVPERGEDGYFLATRADRSSYDTGDLTSPMPVKHTTGTFRGGLLPKASEIPVANTEAVAPAAIGD